MERSDRALSRASLAVYAAPMLGVGAVVASVNGYFAKYAADVLLAAPGAVGLVFGLSKLWDAISDPVVGSWSDRSGHRWGRRRPLMLVSAPLIAMSIWMLWSPPQALHGPKLVAWLAVSMVSLNTATTLFLVPHQALGAELSSRSHLRTRIFAWRQQATMVGAAVALVGGVRALTASQDPRWLAARLALGLGAFCVVVVLGATLHLRERSDFQGRGGTGVIRSLRDIWGNPHARILFSASFIDQLGNGALMVLSPFLMDYVVGLPEHTATLFAVFGVSTLSSVPLWLAMAARIGKRRTWQAALALAGFGYALMTIVGPGQILLVCAASACAGSGISAGFVIGNSLVADVIDYDELETGERKEGAYSSVMSFLAKTSSGVMAMVAGLALQWADFESNAPQSPVTLGVIRALSGAVPLLGNVIAFGLLSRFRLDESEHTRVQRALAMRSRNLSRESDLAMRG